MSLSDIPSGHDNVIIVAEVKGEEIQVKTYGESDFDPKEHVVAASTGVISRREGMLFHEVYAGDRSMTNSRYIRRDIRRRFADVMENVRTAW